MVSPIHVIGGGLAGSEAAWQLARRGIPVVLHEMRPLRLTEAHQTDRLAELVCSNSFRSDDKEQNAVGLLHEELRHAGSLIMRTADIDRSGKVWTYTPSKHKTEHHGHERIIYLGDHAQEIVRPFLKLDPAAYLFSPADADAELSPPL